MQVISLSRLLCGSLSDMQLMEDQAEYILPITDGNITLKHYLWAVLLIIECFFFFFIPSVVAIQRKAEEHL